MLNGIITSHYNNNIKPLRVTNINNNNNYFNNSNKNFNSGNDNNSEKVNSHSPNRINLEKFIVLKNSNHSNHGNNVNINTIKLNGMFRSDELASKRNKKCNI
jgi:hypothetical protein